MRRQPVGERHKAFLIFGREVGGGLKSIGDQRLKLPEMLPIGEDSYRLDPSWHMAQRVESSDLETSRCACEAAPEREGHRSIWFDFPEL
jgi:hypothetical protein